MRRLLANPAARLALFYAVFSGLWILLSDRVLQLLLPDSAAFARVEIYKGWAFVAVTAILWYVLINREHLSRRRTEAILSGQNRDLRLMETAISQIDEGVIITAVGDGTESRRIAYVNPSWCRLTNLTADAVVGKPVLPVIERSPVREDLRRGMGAAVAGRPFTTDTRWPRPDGTTGVIEWSITPLRDADGAITHFVSIQRDVTARRKAEENLERYRLLSDSTRTIMLFVRTTDGQIVDANAAALAAYGYDYPELTSLHVSDIRADGSVTPEAEAMLRTGGRGFVSETDHRRKDGSTFPVRMTATMSSVGGQLLCLVIIQDMTAVRRQQTIQEVLHQIDHLILQKQPLDQILQYACEQINAVFGYRLTWIGLKEESGIVRAAAAVGKDKAALDGLTIRWAPEAEGPTGATVRFGEANIFRIEIQAQAVDRPGLAEIVGDVVFTLALPLTAEGETVGALSLSSDTNEAFDDETVRHLKQFANQVALSILAARDQEKIWLQTAALEAAANATLIADRTGRMLWINRAWTELTGYSAEDCIGKWIEASGGDREPPNPSRWNWELLLAGLPWTTSKEVPRKNGDKYWLEMTVTPLLDATGEVSHVIAIAQDGTQRRQHEEHLRYLALHDPMTGLPNRRALQERLQEMVRSSAAEHKGALLLLDLDHFKLVNDAVGDTGGDEVLLRVADLLKRTLRTGDLLTRFGGDQFAVLLSPITPEAARGRADSFRQAMSERRFRWQGTELNVSVSIGIAMIDGSMDADGVKALADFALAAAKEAGRNQVVLFESERDRATSLAEEGRLAAMIKEALAEKRFQLYLQPIVHLDTGAVDHHEALIRLVQADGSVMLPGAFLGAAERFRLMPAIDRWVLGETTRLLESRPDLRICMNLSGQSLSDAAMLAETECRLQTAAAGVSQRLSFEITETVAVTDIDRLTLWMGQLQQLGCMFALDDFGIGFSSFAYLRDLPADYIKIDGSFIKNLDTDPTNRSLVQAMSTAAHTLGKRVVAECVENEEIARILQAAGIEYGQGYRWGRPSPDMPPVGGNN